MTSSDDSPDFYRRHAERYAAVTHEFLQSVHNNSSHPAFRND